MAKNIQLQIPQPCHENWHAMRPEEQGRFCSSCSKIVVDFSMMTDKEVLTHLAHASGRTCGRFSPDQLNRDIVTSVSRRKWKWHAVWQIVLATFLLSSRAKAQGEPRLVVTNTNLHPKKNISEKAVHRTLHPTLPSTIPNMAFAPITIDTFAYPPPPPVPPVLPLASSGTPITGSVGGLYIIGKCVRRIPVPDSVIMLSDTVRNWLGDTLGIPALKCRAASIYPNPVQRGSVIQVVLRSGRTGTYRLALYNSSGARIMERAVELEGKQQVELLDISSSLTAGIYLVELCSPQLERVYTGKLVVE